MSQIREIAAYWGTRAQGYSERCKIDLTEDTKFDWLDKICKYAPAKQQLNWILAAEQDSFLSLWQRPVTM